jgi:hypothetical protein
MKILTELGSDFTTKDGVKLYSCGCCCCCCCLHSVASGFLFARSVARSVEHVEDAARDGLFGVGIPASGALLLTPIALSAVIGVGFGGASVKGALLCLAFGAPIALPIVAGLSWAAAGAVFLLSSHGDPPEIVARRSAALDRIGAEFAKASATGLALAIPLFFATCALAPVLSLR